MKGSDLFRNQWQAMLLKKFLYTYRNKLMFVIQNIMPIFFVCVTIWMMRTQGLANELQPLTFSLTQYPVAVTVLDSSQNSSNPDLQEIARQYAKIASSYGDNYEFVHSNPQNFRDFILDLGETQQVRINARYLVAASVNTDNIIAWWNNQPLHTAPLALSMVHNAIAKALLTENHEITVTNAPLPYRPETQAAQINNGGGVGTQLAMNICFCMSFVTAFYILFVIKEHASRSKLLQFVGGVRVWTFWTTQLLWDFMTFVFTSLIVVFTIACFQEEALSTFTELGK